MLASMSPDGDEGVHGVSPIFATTHWSVVQAARDGEGEQGAHALETLCQAYWYPLYAFVRRSGRSPHDAEDLTQGFFARLLEKDYLAVGTGCNGFCAAGPIVVVQPEGIFYQKLKVKDVTEIVESHLIGGKPVERLLHKDPVTGDINKTMEDIKFFSKQQLIALRNKGLIDPENIDHYISRKGYQSLKKVLEEKNPGGIIKEVIRSGIRGRGGGGFPAGVSAAHLDPSPGEARRRRQLLG